MSTASNRPALAGGFGAEVEAQRQIGGGERVGQRRIDRADALRVRAGEVDGHLLAFDDNLHGELDGLFAETVGIDEVGHRVLAVGDRLDAAAADAIGVGDQLAHGDLDRLQAVAGDPAAELLLGDLQRSHVGLNIAFDVFRAAGVVLDQRQQVLVHLVFVEKLERRDAQPFAGDMRAEGLPACRAAAEVLPVPPAHGEAEQLVVAEDRHREGGVGNVRPALERVVQDHHVAGAKCLLAVFLDRFLGGEVHRRHVDGAARRLGDEADVRVVDGVGVVENVAQDRRERGLLEHLAHTLAAEIEVAAQDLECHRIEIPDLRCVASDCIHGLDPLSAQAAPSNAINKLPLRSTDACVPGGRTVSE